MTNTNIDAFDAAVIGAGIAGASVASELARAGLRVLLLETESQPGYHTTGRSAALYSEAYGNDVIRAITTASRPFYEAPPAGFASHPLLTPRGVLMTGRTDQLDKVHAEAAAVATRVRNVRVIDADAALARVPVLRREQVAAALLEPDAMDIDVNALHQGYLRSAKAHGVVLALDAQVIAIEREPSGWRLQTRQAHSSTWRAQAVVNAAGAWGDEVAALAGVRRVGLAPLRRTALVFDVPPELDVRGWPAVVDIDESWYFKPDAGAVIASPADETPSPPCDAQPDELDVAMCVDRLQQATTFDIRRIKHAWAGLRTFAPDRTPVVGYEPDAGGFFWLVGQGGYGIQTAPAMARLAAQLVQQRALPADIEALGASAAQLSPRRFRS